MKIFRLGGLDRVGLLGKCNFKRWRKYEEKCAILKKKTPKL